jgi:hypothetical protein
VIEESFLPMRFLAAKPKQFFSDDGSQRVDPFGKRDSSRRNRDEEMNVIGHNDVTADGNVMSLPADAKIPENIVDLFSGQQSKPLMRVEGYEEKRMNRRIDRFQSRRTFARQAL